MAKLLIYTEASDTLTAVEAHYSYAFYNWRLQSRCGFDLVGQRHG